MGPCFGLSYVFLLSSHFENRHGGPAVSLFLHQNLHGLFESVDKAHAPELYLWMKEIGGYFKRFRGGVLQPWIRHPTSSQELDLEARATMAFLEASSRRCDAPFFLR